MRLALYQPDIPQNLGAAIRLTAALEVALDVIEPCGFPLGDKAIRRAAMDYGGCAKVSHHAGWNDFPGFLTDGKGAADPVHHAIRRALPGLRFP
ncbi:MAG: TrmH family RNA methyltransferase [Asticcacaulis sp.]